MVQSIFTISMLLYSVRGTLQIRLEESFKGWKQIKRPTILLRLIMEIIAIIATFISYADDGKYVSGIPP